MARKKAPNIPNKLHGDDREVVGFLQYLIDNSKALVPTGTAVRSYCTTTPTGFLALTGGTYSATDYPDLYAAIGTTTLPTLANYIIKT